MNGKLYGVGVGPGDPELLTVKAVRLIRECPVVAVPDSGGGEKLALQIAAAYVGGREVLHCPMPMTRDRELLEASWKRSADLLCAPLERGEDVAFLTLGDPSIYSTYGYLQELIRGRGFAVEMVPGVPSFCAASAALGEVLCEENGPLHILPAAMPGFDQALDLEGTKVVMKTGKRMDQVLDLLREKDLLGQTGMVERCGLTGEKVAPNLEKLEETPGYFTLLVVKGEGE